MFKTTSKLWVAIALIAASLLSNSAQAKSNELRKFVAENVLGTSFEMSIAAPAEQAKQAQVKVLAEIARLQKVFSSYDENSELSQLNRLAKGEGIKLSGDMLALIQACQQWQKAQPKSFSCRLGKVIDMWRLHQQQQKRPVRPEFRAVARAALESSYNLDDLIAAKVNEDFNWNFGGIAKGYILDQAMVVAKQAASKANAIKIDIGGDAVYWQSSQSKTADWNVGIAIPNAIDDSNDNLLGTVEISTGAIAYSGHSSRTYDIARRSYSHILAPRDGWPTHNPVTAIVKAPDATSADALATAFAVNDVSQSLDWLERHPQYSALLIDSEGRQFASTNWYQSYTAKGQQDSVIGFQAKIQFSLPKIDVAKYRKPYVAIWITDNKGKIVKNLLLLGTGENWLDQIRSWWRKQGRKSPSLIDGFARPTRRPGQYQLLWNGRDDFGQALPAGEYRLFAEAVREHGSYEKISLPFQLGQEPQSVSKRGKKEIESLALESSVHKRRSSH